MKNIKTIVFLIIMLCLTGCNNQRAEHKTIETFTSPQYTWGEIANETLTIWGIAPDMERTYIQKACNRYETLTTNTIEIVQITKDEIYMRMQNAMQGQERMPDIIVSYGGTNIDAFDPDENFYDFSDAQWVKDLTDTSINQTVYHGKIIGLPFWEASVSGTLYNKEIFERYNLTVPATQEEFLKVCDVLQTHGITPLYMPSKEISMMLYQFPLDTIVTDATILKQLNQGDIGYRDIPQMKQILQWYKTMAENGYLGETYLEDDWSGMSRALESEEYAMLLCWDTWLYTDFAGDASKFGIMPAFIGVPEEGTFEGPNLNLFMVNKHSDKLDAALDFITFLADPYNYNAAFEGVLTAPVFKNQAGSISTPQYLENERLIERYYHDSTAWLRIKGFSQMDAKCIYEFIKPNSTMTIEECLAQMDALRLERMQP